MKVFNNRGAGKITATEITIAVIWILTIMMLYMVF